MATPSKGDKVANASDKTTQPHKKRPEDGRRAHSAGPDKPRPREYMLNAPPRHYEKRHFPDVWTGSLSPPWAIDSRSSSEIASSASAASLAQYIEEDSLADKDNCVKFPGDFTALEDAAFEPYLPSVSVLGPSRATDGTKSSLQFPPGYIILPTAYFGLTSSPPIRRAESPPACSFAGLYRRPPLTRHASLTDRPPFYPPGPNQHWKFVAGAPSGKGQRIREARQLYRSPKSRRALGTPTCYKASSSLSSLRGHVPPVWNTQASSRSLSGSAAKRNMNQRIRPLKTQQTEKSKRDLYRSEPQLNKVATQSKSTWNREQRKELAAAPNKTFPVGSSNGLSRDYTPARYYDVPTEIVTSKRYPPRHTESYLPRKTTFWYRSDPDLALTTTESEQEKTDAMLPAVHNTAKMTYQSPPAYFKPRNELQHPRIGTYEWETTNPLVPRRLASSPIQINRTYTKSQRMAYQQEVNNLREGVTVKSSTDTAPKKSTEERLPTYGTLSSVKAASNASAFQNLQLPDTLQRARPAESFVSQLPPPLGDNISENFSRTSARLSEIENTGEAAQPPVTLNVPPLRPLSSSKNQAAISCKACGKYVDIKERMELLNDIFHRFCFKCAICGEELSSTFAIRCNNKWTCQRHSDFKWPAHSDQPSKLIPV